MRTKYVVMAVILISNGASAASDSDCGSRAAEAQTIMSARQKGRGTAYRDNLLKTTTDQVTRGLIQGAWRKPLYSTEQGRRLAEAQFAAEAQTRCYSRQGKAAPKGGFDLF